MFIALEEYNILIVVLYCLSSEIILSVQFGILPDKYLLHINTDIPAPKQCNIQTVNVKKQLNGNVFTADKTVQHKAVKVKKQLNGNDFTADKTVQHPGGESEKTA